MDTNKLKSEFELQLKDANEKIAKAEADLSRLKEYKTKLLGGLETIALLEQESEKGEESQPEISPEEIALQ